MKAEQTDGTLFVKTTLKVLGGKWKILILWHLKDSARRYSELKRLIPDIADKMLIQQLRELENDGIINRKMLSEVPLKVEYEFTDYGRTLIPVIKSLCDWGEKHLQHINVNEAG